MRLHYPETKTVEPETIPEPEMKGWSHNFGFFHNVLMLSLCAITYSNNQAIGIIFLAYFAFVGIWAHQMLYIYLCDLYSEENSK